MNQDIAMDLKIKPNQGSQAMKLKLMMGVLVLCFGARSFADTLCTSNEQAVFSCTLANHKTASLCAPKDLKAPGLYLQYRFGTHQKMELVYPEKMENPQHRFRRAFVLNGDQRGQYVVFTIGEYDYYMYEVDRGANDYTGFSVYKQNRMISNHECDVVT